MISNNNSRAIIDVRCTMVRKKTENKDSTLFFFHLNLCV